jgi:hypothetical protein
LSDVQAVDLSRRVIELFLDSVDVLEECSVALMNWVAIFISKSILAPVLLARLQRDVFDWMRRVPNGSVKLVFALRLFHLDATELPYASMAMRQSVLGTLQANANAAPWQDDIGVLLCSFASIECALELARALEPIVPEMALELVVVIVNEYNRLCRADEPVSLAECQRLLRHLEDCLLHHTQPTQHRCVVASISDYLDIMIRTWDVGLLQRRRYRVRQTKLRRLPQ